MNTRLSSAPRYSSSSVAFVPGVGYQPGVSPRSFRHVNSDDVRVNTFAYPNSRTAFVTNNPGPHGFTEILYSFVSGAGNNGSAFAGLGTNWWYNIAMAFDMLTGRFLMMIPVLALAGNLARKKSVPPSPGTFPVNSSLFTVLLIGVVVIVGALTFFPAVSLGPVLEHLLLNAKQLF